MNYDALLKGLAELVAAPATDLTDSLFADWTRVPGPIGEIDIAFSGRGISYVRVVGLPDRTASGDFATSFHTRFGRPLRRTDREPPGLRAALDGNPPAELPVDLDTLTEFEREVLRATRQIPRGQTRPYGWIAARIGRPKAVRAVGTAVGNNPVPLVIPCHRVVRSDGSPGEYVFGAAAKQRLLSAEREAG